MADRRANLTLADCFNTNRLLRDYLNSQLQLQDEDSKTAIQEIKPVIDLVLDKVKAEDSKFDMTHDARMYRGSYYEKVKIKKPDEFDIDLSIKSLEVDILPELKRPPSVTEGRSTFAL